MAADSTVSRPSRPSSRPSGRLAGGRQGAADPHRRRRLRGVGHARDRRIPGREISPGGVVAARPEAARPRPQRLRRDAQRLRCRAQPLRHEHRSLAARRGRARPGRTARRARRPGPHRRPVAGSAGGFGRALPVRRLLDRRRVFRPCRHAAAHPCAAPCRPRSPRSSIGSWPARASSHGSPMRWRRRTSGPSRSPTAARAIEPGLQDGSERRNGKVRSVYSTHMLPHPFPAARSQRRRRVHPVRPSAAGAAWPRTTAPSRPSRQARGRHRRPAPNPPASRHPASPLRA